MACPSFLGVTEAFQLPELPNLSTFFVRLKLSDRDGAGGQPEHLLTVDQGGRGRLGEQRLVTEGDSYRMREARTKGGTRLNKT